MAYVSSQLRLMVPSMNADSPQLWTLQGTDAATAVDAANFITDAQARGMRKGDIVLYTIWDNITTKATCSGHHIFSVISVASTGADLSNGTAITATNSD